MEFHKFSIITLRRFLHQAANNASTYIVHHGVGKDELTESNAGYGGEDLINSDGKDADGNQLTPAQRHQNNLVEIEDRLKRELRTLGLIDPTPNNATGAKDEYSDEICQELIKVQKSLQEQVINNKMRRAKYLDMVKAKIEQQKIEEQERKSWVEREENATKQLVFFCFKFVGDLFLFPSFL